ncbi:type I-E CRISPR-associated protein Cse1/CasA [Kutzneria buriramensis]|uniref:CRISPR system Cascade subunit CasA n=1 Tax=Kutzneria buriramensis TaxID=1045776 RepID=A0A3E0GXX1_9PSEU|nr:type I-E CRISPR-associated protein Cse1/CasA [Kutzneria buriramensis]REH30694.1 CRISPR system Cascade subunit CasA [Kutzneria buriramensis]
MKFDLVTEPWIPVIDLDGIRREVSLAYAILGAHRLRRISAEAPPMTAALYRLVLAVMHRAYAPADNPAWSELWDKPRLEFAPLRRYLEPLRDRFDLLHPTRPFLQCPALAAKSPSSAAKLVPFRASGNNVTLFDHTTDSDSVRLSLAEAARWLIAAQAFDPGGMKTPFEKDKSSERAPCNYFGVVVVEGATLKETLLLNTHEYSPADGRPELTTLEDRPAWEEAEAPSPHPDQRVPRGWTDLLTWPARRILLSTSDHHGAAVVDKVVVTPGVRLRTELAMVELMAAFRQPTTNGKPKKDAPLLPIRLREVRGVWRHSVELLLAGGGGRQRPRLLDQIADLVEDGYIADDIVYTLRIFGQQLDKNNAVVESWAEEEVPAPVALLRADDDSLGGILGFAVKLADDVGEALRALERDHRAELRGAPTAGIDLAYWPQLPQPFSVFLRSLAAAHVGRGPQTDAVNAWAAAVRIAALTTANRWAEGSPRQGRNLVAAAKQHARFTGRLHTIVALFHAHTAAFITRENTA